jgi:ubiquinone/menaquinone biosynthesis C-methylase UbiE
MRPEFDRNFGCYLAKKGSENLNLGSGGDIDSRFVNLDRTKGQGADMAWDLENTPLPFTDGRFKCVVASHILEHIHNYVELMNDLYRVMQPGGHLIVFVPYFTSTDAYGDPTHVRVFSEQSWEFLNQKIYQKGNNTGNYISPIKCNFFVEAVFLVPREEFIKDKEFNSKATHQWNVVQEMCAILRKE